MSDDHQDATKDAQRVIAISRMEIALIVVFTLFSLGAWLGAEWLADTSLGLGSPAESAAGADARLPLREAGLAHARSMLEANQSQIDELARDGETLATTMTHLRDAYPLPQTITDTQVVTVPVAAVREFLAARARLEVARRAMVALDLEMSELITETRDLSATLQTAQLAPIERQRILARRAATENALALAQQRYAEQRVVASEQAAEIRATYDRYQQLRAMPESGRTPPEVLLQYIEAGLQQLEGQRTIARLRHQTQDLERAVTDRAHDLALAETATAHTLTLQRIDRGVRRFVFLMLVACLLLWLTRALLGWLDTSGAPGAVDDRFVFLVIACLLVGLVAYQFSIALALLLLGVGLIWLLRTFVLTRPPVMASDTAPASSAPPDAAEEPTHEPNP